jgi:hypothetical protein
MYICHSSIITDFRKPKILQWGCPQSHNDPHAQRGSMVISKSTFSPLSTECRLREDTRMKNGFCVILSALSHKKSVVLVQEDPL